MSRGLGRKTLLVGANTLLSRVFGFVRDMVIAATFGAGAGTDAFFVAFRIPNLLRRMFAEGAFSQAFVPVLSEYRSTRTHAETRELVRVTAGTLGAVLLLVAALGMLGAPLAVWVVAPGFHGDPAKFALTVHMVRVLFPYIAFISLTSLAAGVLNSYGRFGAPAFTPVLLNLCLISAALWLSPYFAHPVVALAWGVALAGVLQLAFLVPFVARLGLLGLPRLGRTHEGLRRIARLMLPALLGMSASQVNIVFDTLMASFLVTGSVSWLYYSDRLMEFPLGVFGVALGTVILPSLSVDHTRGSQREFSATLDWALRWCVLVATPAAAALAALAVPLLATLFNYGAFGAHDVHMASESLVAFSVGLVPLVLVKVLAPGYFARQDTRTPVKVGLVAMGSNVVLNLVLVWPLKHAGIALATSLAALINATLLYRGLHRRRVHVPGPGWRALGASTALAVLAMVSVLAWMTHWLGPWLGVGAARRALHLAAVVSAGAFTYLAVLLACGVRPAQLLRREAGVEPAAPPPA